MPRRRSARISQSSGRQWPERLQRVPSSQIPALGPYAKYARDVQSSAAQRLSPESERYRGSVTPVITQDISDAYDKQIALLRGFGPTGSPDLATRRAALTRRNEAFDAAAPVTATLLAALIDVENRDAIAHGFHNAAERKYASLGLGDSLVVQTVAAVAADASAYHEYEELLAGNAAKRLGVSSVLSDERNIGTGPDSPVQFDRGRQLILEALKPLGNDYARRFADLLDPSHGRLDLSGGAHRANTGTSIDAYDAPTALYVTSYTGTLSNLGVIAHEGGHAIHRELMNVGDTPVYQRIGPHDLSEGYAIFNEWLLLDHAADVAPTPAEHARALEALLSSVAIEIFISAEETTFERNLYASAAGHALLDRAEIDDIYRKSIAPYEYWPMEDVGTSRSWMRKSLLFQDPLYLVNYLYASLVAFGLYDRAHNDPAFAGKYEALLQRGFDAEPNVLLATVGIKLDDPALIKRAVAWFKAKTGELRALYAAEPQ